MNNKKYATYVCIGKPMIFKKFEFCNSPTGWIRIDILKDKLRDNKLFKNKFSEEEIKRIMEYNLK